MGDKDGDAAGGVPYRVLIPYGLGTALNDLIASVWFTYVLYFLQEHEGMAASHAALVLLLGQLIDAVCTPLLGLLIDRSRVWLGRKFFVGYGSVLTAAGFWLLFCHPLIFPWAVELGPASAERFAIVMAAVALLQVGWASVQLSHLALIPELGASEADHVLLSSARFAATTASSLTTFALAAAAFRYAPARQQYAALATAIVALGATAVLLFLLFVPEPGREEREAGRRARAASRLGAPWPWHRWFLEPTYYEVALVYAASRVCVVVITASLAFYLRFALALPEEAKGLAPLVMQASSLAASFFLKRLHSAAGSTGALSAGALLVGASCSFFYVLTPATARLVYAAVPLAGAGTAMLMVSAVSAAARLVGERSDSGAFVYARCPPRPLRSSGWSTGMLGVVLGLDKMRDSLGLVEKIATGAVIYALDHASNFNTGPFVQDAISALPAAAAAAAVAAQLIAALRRSRAEKAGEDPEKRPLLDPGSGPGVRPAGGAAV
eukprot:tig00001056_g6645.t1